MALTKQRVIKIAVLGDSEVGKTSLCVRLTTGTFPEKYVPTVTDLADLEVVERNRCYKVNLFDVAGGEDFQRLRTVLYPWIDVFILCFALNDVNSYNNVVRTWFQELSLNKRKSPIILLGTKCDLEANITQQQGLRLKKTIKADSYLECSSKCNKGVSDVFDSAIFAYMKHHGKHKDKKCVIS